MVPSLYPYEYRYPIYVIHYYKESTDKLVDLGVGRTDIGTPVHMFQFCLLKFN